MELAYLRTKHKRGPAKGPSRKRSHDINVVQDKSGLEKNRLIQKETKKSASCQSREAMKHKKLLRSGKSSKAVCPAKNHKSELVKSAWQEEGGGGWGGGDHFRTLAGLFTKGRGR